LLAGRAALRAVATDFKPGHDDVELAVTLNLAFQPIEKIALEFHDLATAQAGHVNVIALGSPLVEMLLSLHMHEIEFIHQAMPLEQFQSAVNGDPVHLRIDFARAPQNLTGIEMLFRSFDDAKDGTALVGHAKAA
jgi:hypothetical protein